MQCKPARQLFDSSRPDYTNNKVFIIDDNETLVLTANNLAPGEIVPVEVWNPNTKNYEPYKINGQTVVLTYEQPSIILDDAGQYRLNTSVVEGNNDVTVTSENIAFEDITSVPMFFRPAGSNEYIEVEVVRANRDYPPIVYRAGTRERIVNTVGQYHQDANSIPLNKTTFQAATDRFQSLNLNGYANATRAVVQFKDASRYEDDPYPDVKLIFSMNTNNNDMAHYTVYNLGVIYLESAEEIRAFRFKVDREDADAAIIITYFSEDDDKM